MKSIILGSLTIENVIETIGLHKPDFLFPELKRNQFEEQFKWLIPDFVDVKSNNLIMVFQSYVIKTKNSNILVDTCVGNDKCRNNRPFWHKQRTPYLNKLKELGLNPHDIDYVMCTHLHADHVGCRDWQVVHEVNGPLLELLAEMCDYHDPGAVELLRKGGPLVCVYFN